MPRALCSIALASTLCVIGRPAHSQNLSLRPPLSRATATTRAPHSALLEADRYSVARWVLSPLAGFTSGGVLALLAGVSASALLCNPTNSYETCVGGVVIGAYAGFLLGAPLGVTVSGGWLHGLGRYSGAFLGTLFGLAIAIPVALIARSELVTYSIAALPAIGGLVVYELQGTARGRSLRGPIVHLPLALGLAISPGVTPVVSDGRVSGLAFAVTLRGL